LGIGFLARFLTSAARSGVVYQMGKCSKGISVSRSWCSRHFFKQVHLNVMPTQPPRILILANHAKAQVTHALEELRPWLSQRAKIVAEPKIDDLIDPDATVEFPPADLAIVLGGDGTMLVLAQHAVDHGLPILGVNFGKLGFLAEFSMDQLREHWETIVSGRCSVSQRLMLEVMVFTANAAPCRGDRLDEPNRRFRALALNDVMIAAGEPFRMIDLELIINPGADPSNGTTSTGDGIIISTPSGSTAYNLSAGGPIVSPGVGAICITPICPHSLAFRSIVINADDNLCLKVVRPNEGTTLVIDGRVPVKLHPGEQIFIRRYAKSLSLMNNPRLNYWKMLAKKMHWAARPRRQ